MIISQTPLRISLVGGGTDFKGFYKREPGLVLSTAIDKYIFVLVKERFDDKIYVSYTKKEIVDHVSEIQHELVREALKMTGIEKGIEIAMLADIPSEGSGLGSSSSLTVGLLNAFYTYQGVQVTAEQLAKEASEIEIDRCGKPIGKQDQYIAAYGGLREFRFNPDESVDVTKTPVKDSNYRKLGSNLLLFYTNKTRKSANILNEQKENINIKFEFLKKIRDLVPKLNEKLGAGVFDEVGHILNENWMLKKELASMISNGEIDEMYDRALAAGAIGGKVAGAGGGGFLLLYVPRNKQDQLREAMGDYRELPFMLEPFGSRIIFNFRRYSAK